MYTRLSLRSIVRCSSACDGTGSNKKVPTTTKSRCHFACVQGVLENHPLFLSVFACAAGVSACAWAVLPQMNRLIHFSDFPGERTA